MRHLNRSKNVKNVSYIFNWQGGKCSINFIFLKSFIFLLVHSENLPDICRAFHLPYIRRAFHLVNFTLMDLISPSDSISINMVEGLRYMLSWGYSYETAVLWSISIRGVLSWDKRKFNLIINCSYNSEKRKISKQIVAMRKSLDLYSTKYENIAALGNFNVKVQNKGMISFCKSYNSNHSNLI